VVHCSAGVGRTGTFIALDILLDMAKEEGVVDIYGLVWKMRRDRVNMIQTVEQYIFVYDALLEALKAGNTAIPCSSFRQEYKSLCEVDPVKNKSKLQEQFETLQLMSPKVKLEDCKSGCKAENADKNRYPDILPADRHRPYLMTRVDGTNDYINAVYLDGFKKRNAYIISQMPMPHTVIDFWRMVYEHECNSVIMLNQMDTEDETYGQYWLEEESSECGPFIIEPISLDTSNPDITVRELRLSYEKSQSPLLPAKKDDKPRLIGQFQLNSWPKGASTPTSASSLIQLIELVERQQQKTGDGPVLIHCDNGVTNSGLYAAVSCIWEKMKVDQEVDIFHAVKHLRYHRPQIVADLEQYQFCFEMVLAYLAEFEIYANFR
jgi:protein tyrosine phosphatase